MFGPPDELNRLVDETTCRQIEWDGWQTEENRIGEIAFFRGGAYGPGEVSELPLRKAREALRDQDKKKGVGFEPTPL